MNVSRIGLYSTYFLCLLLNGCASQQIKQKTLLWKQQEARFFDIPVMMHAQPDYTYQEHQAEECSTFIAYTVTAELPEIQTYYMNQMERFGWRHITTTEGHEVTLVFEKPQKLCIVSLRPTKVKNSIKVVVCLGYS